MIVIYDAPVDQTFQAARDAAAECGAAFLLFGHHLYRVADPGGVPMAADDCPDLATAAAHVTATAERVASYEQAVNLATAAMGQARSEYARAVFNHHAAISRLVAHAVAAVTDAGRN